MPLKGPKKHIGSVLNEALKEGIISEEDNSAMNPEDKTPSKFYCNFKVHKDHKHMEAPPVRPIISGSGAITENISLFVEHHIRDISTKHEAYLQDTPHFLRVIDKLNNSKKTTS